MAEVGVGGKASEDDLAPGCQGAYPLCALACLVVSESKETVCSNAGRRDGSWRADLGVDPGSASKLQLLNPRVAGHICRKPEETSTFGGEKPEVLADIL